MTEYLLTVTGIVLISSILTNVLALGKTSGIIKNVVRLCLYLAILSPIYQFFQNQFDAKNNSIFQNYFNESVIETDTDYIKYCSEKSLENTERLLQDELLQKYGIVATVTVQLFDESKKIEKIYIETIDIDERTIKTLELAYEKRFCVEIDWIQGG